MKLSLILLGGIALSNLCWYGAYRANDRAYMQEEGLRDEADSILRALPDTSVYEMRKTDAGELYVYCQNHGDATVRPSVDFGSIIVSCGQ